MSKNMTKDYVEEFKRLADEDDLVWKELEKMAEDGKSEEEIKLYATNKMDKIHAELDRLHENHKIELSRIEESNNRKNKIKPVIASIFLFFKLYAEK